MNRVIVEKIDRINRYIGRLRISIGKNDPVQAMADCAEISTIADMLWSDFAKVNRAQLLKRAANVQNADSSPVSGSGSSSYQITNQKRL